DFVEPRAPSKDEPPPEQASTLYYGATRSLLIWAPQWLGQAGPIPAESVIPADLSGWKYSVPRDYVAVDPELGRILFPCGQLPPTGVGVSYHYGFSAAMAGGEYRRPLSQPAEAGLYHVGKAEPLTTINAALKAWQQDKDELRKSTNGATRPLSAVIEIVDSGV